MSKLVSGDIFPRRAILDFVPRNLPTETTSSLFDGFLNNFGQFPDDPTALGLFNDTRRWIDQVTAPSFGGGQTFLNTPVPFGYISSTFSSPLERAGAVQTFGRSLLGASNISPGFIPLTIQYQFVYPSLFA